ncbi:MAG: hypothetical protein JTJ18_04365 [Streptococcus sp.]|nr:hypothetical protein [Streptococcus sp.]
MAKGQKLCLLLGSLKVFALTGSVCGAYLVASALYLCFTLRPAIFNSLRPVTVGSGRVELTCET